MPTSGARSGTTSPTTATHGTPAARGQLDHAADHLALEGLLVEEALAGDDEVGALDPVVEVELVGHHVEARHQRRPGRGQPAGQAAGGARRRRASRTSTPWSAQVDLGQALEPAAQQLDLGRRRALLRGEHLGGVDEAGADVAQRHAARRPRSRCSGYSARSAPSPPSVVAEPPTPTSTRRAPASTAAAISSPVPAVDAATGSLPSGPPTSASPDARAISITAVRPSSRHAACDRLAERAGDDVVVRLGPPSTSSVPSPPSAIGTSSHVPPGGAAARRRPRPLPRHVAAQLVGGDHHRTSSCRRSGHHAPHAADSVAQCGRAGRPPGGPASLDRPWIAPVVIVSNRGPLSFRRDDDGDLVGPTRGRRPRVGPRPAGRRHRTRPGSPPPCPTATARPRPTGVIEAEGFRVRLLALDRRGVTGWPTTWSATRCCGSSTTGSATCPRARRFGRDLREAWDAYRAGQPRPSPTPWPRSRPRAPPCSCRTTTSACWASAWPSAGPTWPRCTSATRPSPPRPGCGCCPTT